MKKLFSALASIIIASLIIMACKKGNNNNSQPLTTASPYVAAPYGGQFQVNNVYDDNTLPSAGGANDSSGTAVTLITNDVNIGKVKVNGDTLSFQFNSFYSIPTNVIAPLRGKATWQVTGGNGFGAFTYTTTKSIPAFTNLHLSLSSISRSNNLVITHAVISADSIRYSITDFNNNMATKVVGNSSTGITFTPAMLASLTTTNNATVQVTGITTENSVQGGKNISFLNSACYNKSGVAVN